jgi:hypothetical protein
MNASLARPVGRNGVDIAAIRCRSGTNLEKTL